MSLLSDLQVIVGTEYASDTHIQREHHSRDQSAYAASLPDVVVWPADTAQVSQLARYANEHCIPLIGWGAGTGLEGNSIPLHGGIVVDFSRMDQIVAMHIEDFQVTVQPGLRYKDMNQRLTRHGLFFPPDPGANASIGGMIANNAAGTRTVKYGATRDNVLALEVVLANGEVIQTGSRSIKQSAGYDLTHLFTGSEGTLGLITGATLRLHPILNHASAVAVAFPTMQRAAEAVFGIIGTGLNPAALEILDKATIDALKHRADLDVTSAHNLFIEFSGASEIVLQEELQLTKEICEECGCLDFKAGIGREMHKKLWETRHRTLEIMIQTYPGRDWAVTDVAVPISHYPELMTLAAATIKELDLPGSIVGHAGDGNLHTVTFFYPDDADARARVDKVNEVLVERAISLDGTCTGEHGVGIGKRKYMEKEHGQPAMTLMRALKHTLDPNNILNPGKVL